MSEPLGASEFPRFFEAVRGVRPFPWQTRLMHLVAATGCWPRLLDLPTGSGKTACLDIAVFLLALDAGRPALRTPRRTVLVVDRRVVVDQAAAAGQALREALEAPRCAAVRRVADALQSLSGGGPPLLCAALRGGIVRDESWAQRPDVPAVLSATVDQVGSRLLFRGYGVSEAMRPVHAGLLGTDTLVLLDEVHLARPFAQTLRALAERYQPQAERPLPSRWQVVELSATPADDRADPFGIDGADRDRALSPVLARRLDARKPVEMRRPVAGAGPNRAALASACQDAVDSLLDRDGVRTVGVIVNRVETARAVARRLADEGVPALLLTGRMRPLDRDRMLAAHRHRLATGREPRDDGTPLVVVGTQCIEAGADFDFDGLVSECASLDALRQRFGRVDRDGVLTARGAPAPGILLVRAADIGDGADDPVYGGALAGTWRWLGEREAVDFGHGRMPEPADDVDGTLLAPHADAPLLFPAHLDAWVQTAPSPSPEPEVATWLHGMGAASSDVSVIWREELSASWLERAVGPDRGSAVVALLSAGQPSSGEAATIPIGAVRRWLSAEDGRHESIADVEGRAEVDAGLDVAQKPRPFVRWRGDGSTIEADPRRLRPGDVVVVPAAYGGISLGSWDPEAREDVEDRGHEAQIARRRRALRLLPRLWAPLEPPVPSTDEETAESDLAIVRRWLREEARGLEGERGSLAAAVGDGGGLRVLRLEGADGAPVFVASALTAPRRWSGRGDGSESEPETSPFSGREVLLQEHLDDVAAMASAFAQGCGLDQDLVEDLAMAGRLHDVGKVDPRFQLMLHQGSELRAAEAAEPLAKSALPALDTRRRQRARERSGYPRGQRHELLSVAMAEDVEALASQAGDWELVLHLVASHHGHCRPFAPVVAEPAALSVEWSGEGLALSGRTDHGLARLDRGVPDRFWRLVARYGWFRLAWLESLLRLADHEVSGAEQTRGAES